MNPFCAWLLAATFFEAWSSVSGGICQTFVWSNLRPVSQRWSQRSCVRYTSETQAGSLSTSVPVPQRAHEKPREVQELRELTWVEAEARIKRDIAETSTCPIIVPVGATEQHGPNGLIGTDHMTAEAVARGLSEVTGALVAPSVNYGMSVHHSDFSGTVTLSPATFVGVVRDVSSSLVRSGFTHVLFINGHGGNVGPAYKAFADFAAEQNRLGGGEASTPGMKSETTESPDVRLQPVIGSEGVSVGDDAFSAGGGISDKGEGSGSGTESRPRPRLKLINWYGGREASALANELYGKEKGQHATPDEVALTQHLFPASVKAGVTLDPSVIQVAKDLGGMTKRVIDEETGLSVMDPHDFRRRFPDGRMFSNPGLATPDHGRRLLDAAVSDAVEALRKFRSGEDLVEEAAAAAARAAAMASRKRQPRWGQATGKGRWAPRGERELTPSRR
ncbi:unnamed protein product [Ascophyllum nodosum]